jgi:hypothetical protein
VQQSCLPIRSRTGHEADIIYCLGIISNLVKMSTEYRKYLKLKNSEQIVNLNHYSMNGVLTGADFRTFEKSNTGMLICFWQHNFTRMSIEERMYKRLSKNGYVKSVRSSPLGIEYPPCVRDFPAANLSYRMPPSRAKLQAPPNRLRR